GQPHRGAPPGAAEGLAVAATPALGGSRDPARRGSVQAQHAPSSAPASPDLPPVRCGHGGVRAAARSTCACRTSRTGGAIVAPDPAWPGGDDAASGYLSRRTARESTKISVRTSQKGSLL